MNNVISILMYLTAFLPALIIIWVKDVVMFLMQTHQAQGKLVWSGLINAYYLVPLVVICAISLFLFILLRNNKKMAVKIVTVKKTTNKVMAYTIGYYSLFVIAAIRFSFTSIADVVTLCLLIIIIGIVYIKNGFFYINPTVSLFRHFVYDLEYEENEKVYEKIVISKNKIRTGETISICQSKYDFTLMEKKVTRDD